MTIEAEKKYSNFEDITIGDDVAVEGTVGMCSGGAAYGLVERVVDVTSTSIVTVGGTYCRTYGNAITPPYAYKITWWRRV